MEMQELNLEQEGLPAFCLRCGEELDDFTGWRGPGKWYGQGGFVHHCRDCQEAYYEALAEQTSPNLSLFYCCAVYNVPLEPTVIPALEGFQRPWVTYLERLTREGLDGQEEVRYGFLDGTTDILKLFGGQLSDGAFAAAVLAEGVDGRPGSKRQRKDWGESYTAEEYKELDRYYEALSERFRAGGISGELELTLRKISKWNLLQQKYVEDGEIGKAQKLSGMVTTEMSNAAIRKKDELPADDIRVDAVVDSLEKKGLARNGVLLPYDKLLEKIQGDNPHYPYSKDVVDQILLLVLNTMRGNAGQSELYELPEEMRFEAAPGEFEAEETEREKKVKAGLGLVRLGGGE